MSTAVTQTGLKTLYLIKVEPEANNNKFYRMIEVGDGTFKAEYGRVGNPSFQTEIYDMSKWDKKYKEKTSIRKGYEDKTHLILEEVKSDKGKSTITEITDKVVAGLVKKLQSYAKVSVETNYNVSSSKVTQAMVNEAQVLVDEITHLISVGQKLEPVNKLLVDLFKVIPRKMKHVKDHLIMTVSSEGGSVIKTKDDLQFAQQLIGNEQATLDVMAGQVSTQDKTDTTDTSKVSNKTILESMGLLIVEAPDSAIPLIKKLMGPNANQFKKAYEVVNLRTQKNFDSALKVYDNKTVELFWHGSRNENWWGILDKGWMIRPANAAINGKMFGYGIYWANKFQKSLGYTSFRGSYWAGGNSDSALLALSQVHVGNQLKIKNHQSWCYDLTHANLRKRGDYDSLYAQGGADLRNDEFIVYNENQCTIKYLVEAG